MSVFDDIAAARRCGKVRCGATTETRPNAVAAAFGLDPDAATSREIDRGAARALVLELLQRDLAYGAPRMPAERAAELADAFMAETARPDAGYFTNVDASWPSGTFATSPATSATFDSGVVVVSSAGSACFWVEDED